MNMLKRITLILAMAMTFNWAFSQPVAWKYSIIKTGDKIFELHIKATIEKGWHLYSQTQPEDAIAVPTAIQFSKNPLLDFDPVIKEIGRQEKYNNKELGIEANQYSGSVEFVQTILMRIDTKTNIEGKIKYQACTDEKCLPPANIIFSMALNSSG